MTSKSGYPTFPIRKAMNAARAANGLHFDLCFLRKAVRVLKPIRGVILFDLQRTTTAISEAWALGTEFAKAETPPLMGVTFHPESVSLQLLAKIL